MNDPIASRPIRVDNACLMATPTQPEKCGFRILRGGDVVGSFNRVDFLLRRQLQLELPTDRPASRPASDGHIGLPRAFT
jgi:hypothetical protein